MLSASRHPLHTAHLSHIMSCLLVALSPQFSPFPSLDLSFPAPPAHCRHSAALSCSESLPPMQLPPVRTHAALLLMHFSRPL